MLGPVELVDEVDSTNAELLRRARAGAPHGSVLAARHQTAGRGRLDRGWEAPPGSSLLISVLLRPTVPAEELYLVAFAAGLAALEACQEVAGVELSLKWPNDVVLDTGDAVRKVAGLLAESIVEGGDVSAVVVGMGLNVEWPGEVPDGGASLGELAGEPVDVDALRERWLERFDADYGHLATEEGRSGVLARYRRACSTLGRHVRVQTGDGVVEGVAVDVDERGHLVVHGPEPRVLAVGDVVHVRGV